MAGAKGKKSGSTMVLDPPEPAVAAEPDVALPDDVDEVDSDLEMEVLQELGLLEAQAHSGDVVLVGDTDGTDLLQSLDDVQHLVDDYWNVDQQLAWMATHHDEVVEADGAPLPIEQAYDKLAAVPDAPAFGDLDEFSEVYDAHLAGVEHVPQWKMDQLEAAKAWIAAQNDPELSAADKFAALQAYADTVRGLEDAAGDAFGDEYNALKADTKAFLEGQSPAQLREIAHANGVAHPLLLSGGNPNDASGKNALAAVLDPAYGQDAHHKQVIAQKAHERFAQLQSGAIGNYQGVALDDVLADDAAAGVDAPAAQGAADVLEVDQATLSELQALHAMATKPHYTLPYNTMFERAAAQIELDWKLQQAVPGDGVSVGDLADLQVGHAPFLYPHHLVEDGAVDKLAAITGHDATTIGLANGDQLKQLIDPDTPAAQVTDITAAAKAASEQLEAAYTQYQANYDAWETVTGGTLGTSVSQQQVKDLFNGWQQAPEPGDLPAGVNGVKHPEIGDAWAKLQGSKHNHSGLGMKGTGAMAPPDKQLRSWMKQQPLGQLRTLAADLGMGDAAMAPATRAQVQNWLMATAAGQEHQASHYEELAKLKQTAGTTPKPKPAPTPAGTATAAKAPSVTKPVVTSAQAVGQTIKHVSYAKQLADLEGLLAQAQGAATDIPPRSDATVASAQLVPDHAGNVSGGAHTKTGWRDPSTGEHYFAKTNPGKNGPARMTRIHAEVAAAQVKDAVGIPTIPCYHRQVDGQDAALQPKLNGVSPLPAKPDVSSLSQSDVDQVIRNQVGDWLVGDHDAHGENWVRTASGSLVRCDLGTAWKYAGSDKLNLDYTAPQAPTSGRTVFQWVMHAQQNGGLADGVKVNPNVAVGVVNKVENLPAPQFRDMLRPVAESGAASPDEVIKWRPRMRKVAAATHGIPEAQVTNAQIADAFLDQAEERRGKTRDGFAKMFADAGLDASALRYIT